MVDQRPGCCNEHYLHTVDHNQEGVVVVVVVVVVVAAAAAEMAVTGAEMAEMVVTGAEMAVEEVDCLLCSL